MSDSVYIIIATVLVLLAMGVSLLLIYLRSIRHELETQWQIVLDNLRLRLDKIPNLIETVRQYAPQETKTIDELIKLRADVWPMEKADKEKVQKEMAVTLRLRELRALTKKYPELARDTNFLALNTEFKDAAGVIELTLENYNNRVRKYNSKVRFILFLPVALIFGFPKMPVFEFEP